MSKADTSADLESLSPIELFEYASYIPGRTDGGAVWPRGSRPFKRHRTLGQARAAIGSAVTNARADRAACRIYKAVPSVHAFNGGRFEWEEVKADD